MLDIPVIRQFNDFRIPIIIFEEDILLGDLTVKPVRKLASWQTTEKSVI